MEHKKTPLPTVFRHGPLLFPVAGWIPLLSYEIKGLLLLPVVILRMNDFPYGIERVYVGVQEQPTPEETVLLHLNDDEMGIPLSSHLENHCADASVCKVWLTGYWRKSAFPTPFPSPLPPQTFPFTVRDVMAEGPESPLNNSEARIWIQDL